MLEREIMCDLEAWKARPHHPLILSGLRQTGKTFVVREFGARNFPNVVYLDLRANAAVHAAFEGAVRRQSDGPLHNGDGTRR